MQAGPPRADWLHHPQPPQRTETARVVGETIASCSLLQLRSEQASALVPRVRLETIPGATSATSMSCRPRLIKAVETSKGRSVCLSQPHRCRQALRVLCYVCRILQRSRAATTRIGMFVTRTGGVSFRNPRYACNAPETEATQVHQ